jgi:hypothetical protein
MKALSVLRAMVDNRSVLAAGSAAAFIAVTATQAKAVEGGVGAYFLGTRDTFAGIVPPPGTYLSFSYDRLSGEVDGLSVGGIPIRADADLELNLLRIGITQSFDGELWGGTPAINLTIPILDATLTYTAVTPPIAGADIEDGSSGVGDLTFTGMVGWHRDKLHYSTGMSIYMPTGDYDTATVDVAARTVDAMSNSKNVWSFQPFFAVTWLNTVTGLEASGAASLLFSTKNNATDYQTAPAIQLEGAIVQRARSGWGFGLTGYYYQQLADDSGPGAEQTRAALGAKSLQARVAGIGPIVTFSGGELFGGDVSLEMKYVSEFKAKRRIESDVVSVSLTIAY